MINTMPRHVAADVQTHDDDLTAYDVAGAVLRIARDKGFPHPVKTIFHGNHIELRFLWPHLFQWMGMLDELGQANVPDDYVDDGDLMDRTADLIHYERGWLRRQALPNLLRQGEFAVHGWTNMGGGIKQQWVLTPVDPLDECQHCGDLPEPARQPLGVEAWAARAWFDLTGQRWEERKALAR